MRVGTSAHRDLFCKSFVETHRTFEPEQLPWPDLDGLYLERLRTFPFWSYARSIEQRAGVLVTTFSQTLDDPVIRDAVALQGYEEDRHGRLMDTVIERYGIDAPPMSLAEITTRREDFNVFGFGECVDSFIGFGAFALARQRKLFPDSLMDIFENVLNEEARHIVFFTNWWYYEEARDGRDQFGRGPLTALSYHVKSVIRTIQGPAGGLGNRGVGGDFGDLFAGLTPAMFLETALSENRRRMSAFDSRLLRPRVIPTVATIALTVLKLLPPLKAPAAVPALSTNGSPSAEVSLKAN